MQSEITSEKAGLYLHCCRIVRRRSLPTELSYFSHILRFWDRDQAAKLLIVSKVGGLFLITLLRPGETIYFEQDSVTTDRQRHELIEKVCLFVVCKNVARSISSSSLSLLLFLGECNFSSVRFAVKYVPAKRNLRGAFAHSPSFFI